MLSLRRSFDATWGLMLALGPCACAADRPAERAAPSPPARAVQFAVLGDSLAFGTGAGDTSGGFAFRLFRVVAAQRPGSQITNVAIGGSTVADVLRLQVARLRERPFDLVLLCVGGNDVVRGVPTPAFARDYRALLTAIRRSLPRAAIVAVGVPDVSISPLFAEHAALVRRLAQADDRAARSAAQAAGARYVDLFDLTRHAESSASFLSQDRFHPSDEGHAKIAAQALPAVQAALHDRAGPQERASGNSGKGTFGV